MITIKDYEKNLKAKSLVAFKFIKSQFDKIKSSCDKDKYYLKLIKFMTMAYIHEIIDDDIIYYTLVFLDRIQNYKNNENNVQYLYEKIVISFLIIHKFLVDTCYENSSFRLLSGIDIKTIHFLSIDILNYSNFDLTYNNEEIEKHKVYLQKYVIY
jgi:hypothetical protein